jgi:DNA-binding LacI/PurR family transcriptional regulator
MTPKYIALAETLRNNIKRESVPGDRLPTRRELMEQHKVSLSTVEGALRILSDEKLISCHVGRGTFVNNVGTPEKQISCPDSICLFSKYSRQAIAANAHQGPIIEGVQSVLAEAGLRLMLSDYDSAGDANHYTGFTGLVFMAPEEDQKKIVEKFQNTGVPSVIISTTWEDVDIPSVDCDNQYGIRCALRYLADRGHTIIGYMDQIVRSFDSLARRSAFKNMSAEFGIEPLDGRSITIDYDYLDAKALAQLKNMFTSDRRPTALVFSSLFPVTMQVVSELGSMGLSVPQDVSIIGFDDSSWARCTDPALTVIQQPLNNMGRHAAERLIEQMNGKTFIKNEIMPIELIERNSVVVAGNLAKEYASSTK